MMERVLKSDKIVMEKDDYTFMLHNNARIWLRKCSGIRADVSKTKKRYFGKYTVRCKLHLGFWWTRLLTILML